MPKTRRRRAWPKICRRSPLAGGIAARLPRTSVGDTKRRLEGLGQTLGEEAEFAVRGVREQGVGVREPAAGADAQEG